MDGLIGWEVLARYITTFDYAGKSVTLSLPGSTSAPAGAHVVPFVFYGTQPQIACTIDGIPAECAIDTGARDTISFMAPFTAAHPQIVPAALSPRASTALASAARRSAGSDASLRSAWAISR